MSIRFISSGESWEKAFTRALDFLRESEGTLLLGPALGEAAKEWIKHESHKGRPFLLGNRIQEWDEWIQGRARTNALAEGQPFKILNQAGLREFFRAVLGALSEGEAFYHLKDLWREERFFAGLLESVTEARLAGLSEMAAIERAKEMLAKGSDTITREAYQDFWSLLLAYEHGLSIQGGVHDAASLVKQAMNGGSPDLFLLGFDSLSLLETDLIQAIARESAVSVALALPESQIRGAVEGKDEADHTAVLFARALAAGFPGEITIEGAPDTETPRRFLLDGHAPSEEMRAAAAFAREALGKGRNVRFILAPGALESHSEIFREELNLPRNFFGRQTLSHPTARLFLHALELKERGYELNYGLELAALLDFTLGKFGEVPAEAMRLGVRRGLRDWQKDPALGEFAAFLQEIDRLIPARANAGAFAEAVRAVAELCGIGELARRSPDRDTEREAHSALAALLRHGQMLSASVKEELSFAEWFKEWKSLLAKAQAGEAMSFFPRLQFYRYGEWLPPAGAGDVTIALGWDSSVAPHRSFSFYLEEGARRKLSDLSLPSQVQEELAFLDQMKRISASGGTVLFSWSRHDASGKEIEPSWIASALPFSSLPWPELARRAVEVPPVPAEAPVNAPVKNLSASLLELYKECGFRAFALKVLRLEDKMQAASLDLNHLDTGSIVHRTLELYYGDHKGKAKAAGQRAELLKLCLDQAVGEQKIEYFKGNQALRDVQVERLRKVLGDFLEMDAENYSRFPHFRDPDVEVEISGELGPYKWKGKVDRIDIDEANKRFLVIDYKTGASTPSSGEIEKLERFQLPLYMDAAEKLYPGYEPAGGVYVSLKTGERKQGLVRKEFNENKKEPGKTSYFALHARTSSLKSDEDFSEIRRRSREEALRLAHEIHAGHFAPVPHDDESCGRCEVRPACRIREIQAPPRENWERVAPDFSGLYESPRAPEEKKAGGKGFNEEQAKALEQTGLVFIEASAGTGKTTVIVEKIRRFLRGRMDQAEPSHRAVERFAAISFTDKSASELASRLAASIMAEADMGARVAAQAIRQISTIHGFCRKIISDFPVEAGSSPLAQLMDERDAEALRARAMEEFFLYPPEEARAPLELLFGLFPRVKIEEFLRKLQGRRLLLREDIALYRAWFKGETAEPGTLVKPGAEKDALAALLDLSDRFEEVYARLKKEGDRLDFNDLEELSLKALSHPHVQHFYRDRFALLLVDEFQDTNSVQRQILEKIARPGWQNLFVVGDAKQSIYRFRAADVSVFQGLRKEAEKAGSLVTLFRNYRSRAELVSAANQVTASIFPAPGIDAPEFEAVAAEALAFRPKGGRVEVIAYEDPAEKISAEERRELEAKMLVEAVQAQIAKGRSPGDIAVLMRKMSGNEAYLKALTHSGIPFRVGSSKGFYSQSVIVDGIALLRTLYTASNDMALLALLRSPWVRLADAEILAIQQRGNPRDPLWQSLREGDAPRLFAWKQEAPFRSFSEMLEIAYRAYPLDRREHLQAVKFLSILRGMESEAMPRLEILERISTWSGWEKEENSQDDSTMPEPGSGGAVQVMTVHASKGLEFDVTILPDLSAGLQPDRSALRLVPGVGIALKLEEEEKPPAYGEVGEKNKERDLAESKRLLYVALTRGKEECIVFLPKNAKKDSWAALLTEAKIETAGEAAAAKAAKMGTEKAGGEEFPAPNLPFLFQTSITEVAALQFCGEFHRRKFVQGWDDQVMALWEVPVSLRRKRRQKEMPAAKVAAMKLLKSLGIENKERGIALHRVLERIGENGLSLGELWLHEAYVGQGVDPEHAALEELIQLDLSLLASFLDSPLGRDLFAAGIEAYPEAAFQWLKGQTLVHGAMDRLIRRPDGSWVVVDYKSSILEESLDRYRFQVASYMVAVHAYAKSLGDENPRVLGYLVDLYECSSHAVEAEIEKASLYLDMEIHRTRRNYTLAEAELDFKTRGIQGGDHCFHCPYSMHCEIGLAFK
jgi:ATP-dependent exoDNAse (exonuclease V) beta subunit